MGWAKYYEDNVSIYDDRMYFKESNKVSIVNDVIKQKKTTNSTVIVKKEVNKRVSS